MNIQELATELRGMNFCVRRRDTPRDDSLTLHTEWREELTLEADTLAAHLAPKRAVLYQRNPAPFTSDDLRLRGALFSFYPYGRPTFLPFYSEKEPEFDVRARLIRNHLVVLSQLELVETPARGMYLVTDLGREVLRNLIGR